MDKMKKIKKFMLCFIMSILIASTSVITSFAAEGDGTVIDEIDPNAYYYKPASWWQEFQVKASLRITKFVNQAFNLVLNQNLQTALDNEATWQNYCNQYGLDYDGFISFCASRMEVKGDESEIRISDQGMDELYQYVKDYLDANTGWWNIQMYGLDMLNPSGFYSKPQYNAFINFVKSKDSDYVFFGNFNQAMKVDNVDNCIAVAYAKQDSFLASGYNAVYGRTVIPYYDWVPCKMSGDNQIYIKPDGTIIEGYQYFTSNEMPSGYPYFTESGNMYFYTCRNGQLIRAYKTVADLKAYTVGKRPYFASSTFYNYDKSKDNTFTISDDALQNGSVYGDVYNIVINNGGDGLTEDELRKILDEYFSRIGNGGGGSGGGSSGGGLSGLLSGLGSLGDALLAVIGKLLEYVGKAVELFTGTIEKVLDIIPKGFTELLTGLFPFIPQEWTVAIELSLVLGVIVGIVGIFKK